MPADLLSSTFYLSYHLVYTLNCLINLINLLLQKSFHIHKYLY